MARDVAVAALVSLSTGVMCGVIVTTALAIRSRGRRNSVVGLSLDFLEIKVRRLIGGTGTRLQRPHRRLTGRLLVTRTHLSLRISVALSEVFLLVHR